MTNLKRSIRIRIVCADSDSFLKKCIDNDVEVFELVNIDILTKEFTINHKDLSCVKREIESYNGSICILQKKDCLLLLKRFLSRPVLLCGAMLFLLLLTCITGRIYFIEISGNQTISSEQILSKAERYGLKFGTKAEKIRSEEIKNAILDDFPGLQWVGVTTNGVIAKIQVKERSSRNTVVENTGYWGIYASRDGILSEMSVVQGSAQFQVGDSVNKGDLLISAHTDCGIKMRVEKPIGEVFAYTLRNLCVVAPKITQVRGPAIENHVCYKVRIGKKVINLCNHSGIHDATCVKMYTEDYWTLPGNFQLPISVIKIHNTKYRVTSSTSANDVYQWLPMYTRLYLQKQMIAGEILSEDITWNEDYGAYLFLGSYSCQEMIGQIKSKETFD